MNYSHMLLDENESAEYFFSESDAREEARPGQELYRWSNREQCWHFVQTI